MKVSIAQVTADRHKENNLRKAEAFIKEATQFGSDLVVFPEMFMIFAPGTEVKHLNDVAESIDGPFVTKMASLAKSYNVNVMFGMYEKKHDENERAYNAVLTLNRNGKIIDHYRKTHLYDAFLHKESDRVVPGSDTYGIVELDVGKVGLMICYELRFPEIARELVLSGADVLVVPTAWVKGELKDEHWSTLLKARAIENTVYVLGANQVGNIYNGLSMIYDPMGVTVASAGEEEALIHVNIDQKRVSRVRKSLPCLENRRPELYSV